MNEYRFGVTGQERKKLVTAISEVLNIPKEYLGMPSYGYQVGNLTIDRDGTVTGEMIFGLLTALAERGFIPESVEETPEATVEPETAEDAPETITETETTEDALETITETETVEDTPEPATDNVCIEVPLDVFTPETLDNLCKMVSAKEPLIKKALGVDKLHIKISGDKVTFDWFRTADSDTITAYSQFISQLCKTAKEKKRVTAKQPESFENEKFTMRVWLIGLGMVGDDFKTARKLLTQDLSGNGAWRFGKPEKKHPTE